MALAPFPSAAAVAALDMSGGPGVLGYDLTDQQYRDAFTLNSIQRGYRLVDLWGYESNSAARYAAIWQDSPEHPVQFSQHAILRSDYQTVFDQRKAEGYRPVHVCGYTVDGTTRYAAIWEKAAGPAWAAGHDMNILNIGGHLRSVRQMGYRIADLDGYTTFEPSPDGLGSTTPTWVSRFSSIWVESDGREWTISFPVNIDSYQGVFEQMTADGWSPVHVTAFGSTPRVMARWEKLGGQGCVARHGIDSATFTSDLPPRDADGFRPAVVGAYSEGHGAAAQPRFNPLWRKHDADHVIPDLVAAFLRYYEIPGLSMAVARGGRLMYSRGFGIADKGTGDGVQTLSRFRIASISKPVTAAAVTRLIDQGRLTLNDTVFGPGGHLAALGAPLDARASQITIRHLLQHGAGGWSNDANDPMYTNLTLDARELIKTVIATTTLDHAPGTTFAYSNFGYCVLGRVIEDVTGEAYEAHVRQHILAPCGISAMEIAGDTLADRRPDEVVYYSLDGTDPYGIRVSRMDAHGGWLANAIELLRFAIRVDGLPSVTDVLAAGAITTMSTPSGLPGSNGYAAGWNTNTDGTWWHDGSLPGTRSILVRTVDGFCWAVLINSGRTVKDDPTRDTLGGLDALMWAIRAKVDFWPFAGIL